MTASETWLPEPRGGSRVSASKRSSTINPDARLAGAWLAGSERESKPGIHMGHGSDAGRSADMSARRTCWAGRRASGGAGLRSFTGGQRKWHRTRRAGTRDWETDRTASAEQFMDPAPTTLRPSDPLEKPSRCWARAIEALFLSPIQMENCWAPSLALTMIKSPAANRSCPTPKCGLDGAPMQSARSSHRSANLHRRGAI